MTTSLLDLWRRLTPDQRQDVLDTWPTRELEALQLALVEEGKPDQRARWKADPGLWARERMGAHLWSKQLEIFESVVHNPKTVVRSCHQIGKSFTAALVCGWWIDVHPPGTARFLSTAPTAAQVRGVLWNLIGRLAAQGNLPGRVNQAEWRIVGPYGNEEQVGVGRKAADSNPTAMSGVHAENMLCVIDEGGGIADAIWDAMLSLAANESGRILAIGNPDFVNTRFHKAFDLDSSWSKIHVSAFDSPNFTKEDCPPEVKRQLVGPTYEEETRRLGVESAVYRSKILGEFTESTGDLIISPSMVARARTKDYEAEGPVSIGLDVGGGGDRTALAVVHGWALAYCESRHTPTPRSVVEFALEAILATGATRINVDSIGIGFGIAGHLDEYRRLGLHNAEVFPINVAEKSSQPDRFYNLKSELHWSMREVLEEVNCPINFARMDDETAVDLTAASWKQNALGRILVEPKAAVRKRLGRSTDKGDAVLLGYYRGQQMDSGSVYRPDGSPERPTTPIYASSHPGASLLRG